MFAVDHLIHRAVRIIIIIILLFRHLQWRGSWTRTSKRPSKASRVAQFFIYLLDVPTGRIVRFVIRGVSRTPLRLYTFITLFNRIRFRFLTIRCDLSLVFQMGSRRHKKNIFIMTDSNYPVVFQLHVLNQLPFFTKILYITINCLSSQRNKTRFV